MIKKREHATMASPLDPTQSFIQGVGRVENLYCSQSFFTYLFLHNQFSVSFLFMFKCDVIKQLLRNILYQTILFSTPVWLKPDSCKLVLGKSLIHAPSERKWNSIEISVSLAISTHNNKSKAQSRKP